MVVGFRLFLAILFFVHGAQIFADEQRAYRPGIDTADAAAVGNIGESYTPTPVGGFTLPSDLNITHNLTVGNDLVVYRDAIIGGTAYVGEGVDANDATTLAIGSNNATGISIGSAGITTTMYGLVNAAAAGLVLPVNSTAPASGLLEGSVVDVGGILYMYDASRSAWLSVNRPIVWSARAGTVSNSYLRLCDSVSTSATGYQLMRDATITGISVSSGGNVWYVASVGGDFPDLQTALASPSVVNGDVIKLAPETFTTLSQINVNKSVTIEGCGSGATIQTAGTAVDPIYVLYITVGNVVVRNVAVKQRKSTNTSVEAAINVAAAGATGIVIGDVTAITTMEFGIIMHAAQFSVEGCTFEYQGAAGNTHRFITVYGNNGNSRIVNNIFTPSSDSPARTIFCLLTAGGGDTYGGSLLIDSNMQSGGNLRQFILQESFAGPVGGFQLYISNNSYTDLNGSVAFYAGAPNILDLFSSIVLANNYVNNGAGRGLIGFDGVGAGMSPGSTTWYIDGNVIANPSISASGWASACSIPGLAGYNTAVFVPFTIAFSPVIPVPPVLPILFTIQIRANGCPDPLFTVDLTEQNGIETDLNVPVAQGDRLQTYISGTAYNPTVGIEYAYQVV